MTNLSQYAIAYAGLGLEIFPVDPATKRPLVSQHKATTDAEQIEAWWRRWPEALIGHRISAEHVLLDIDPRHGGLPTWKALRAELPTFTTRTHYSGREDKGGHVWFRRPEPKLSVRGLNEWARQRQLGRSLGGTRWEAGIDILQRDHRYTILPPSPHPDTGKPYRWAPERDLEAPVVPMPALLAELVTEAPEDAAEGPMRGDGRQWREIDSIADWYSTHTRWTELLPEHGWTIVSGDGDEDGSEWRHPEATNEISATVRHGCLFVYSTSTGFEVTESGEPHGYTPFAAYAVLAHDSDQKAAGGAARALQRKQKGESAPLDRQNGPPDSSDTRGSAERLSARLLSGGAILDQPEIVPAVWGDGSEVLWSEGEPLLIAAPPGVGKTTLAGQLVGGLVGIRDDVLGWPMQRAGKVLYIASDRPSQAMRSMRRQFSEDNRAVLDERLIVWKGPPPTDLAREPMALLELCREVGADAVILDSLKDMAVGLTDDAVGAGLNQALQHAVADGIEVCSLHHQRKGRDGAKPKTLEDVYGSTWITAGAGSVILLWGSAGDVAIELIHLKQPVDEIGPLKIEHDHGRGSTTVYRGFDPLRFLQGRGSAGATATDAAKAWLEKPKPTRNEIAKARRKLEGLVDKGLAIKSDSSLGGDGGSSAAVYKAMAEHARSHARTDNENGAREVSTARAPRQESPVRSTRAPTRAMNSPEHARRPTPLVGGSSLRCAACDGHEDEHEGAFHPFTPKVEP